MQKCPILGCGRQFENQLTMIEHVKRRHPIQAEKIKQNTLNQMFQKQQKMTEQMNKLPKMNRILQMSKDKKPLQFQRRSTSKKRNDLISVIQSNQTKVGELINQSRQIIKQNNSSVKLIRRPSSSKNSSQNSQKLPLLNTLKGKKFKLESLKSDGDKSVNNQIPKQKLLKKQKSSIQVQTQNEMYSTAPNFAKPSLKSKIASIRSRSKGKELDLINKSQIRSFKDEKQFSTIQTRQCLQINNKNGDLQNSHSIQSEKLFQEKAKTLQRPIKTIIQKSMNKKISQKKLVLQQSLAESLYIQNGTNKESKIPKQFTFKPKISLNLNSKFNKKQVQKNIINSQIQIQNQNWKQRTVTLRNKNIQNFQIPIDSQTQYLFAINCQIKTLNLNECYSLIELTLNNNKIQNFLFLQQTDFGGFQNLQSLYLDHNKIQNLNTLPTYLNLNKISLAFNKLQNLKNILKVLANFTQIQQLDFSFNPIRKQQNYKQSIVSVCKNLKRLDGMSITKFDRQLANQYQKIYQQNYKIIPLNYSPQNNKCRPSTGISTNCQDFSTLINYSSLGISQKQLDKQIEILQKMIKNTKEQFQIIKQENNTLSEQIQNYKIQLNQNKKNQQTNNPKLYKKLCHQVQQLQILNFLQYASQKQLEDLLIKKIKQNGYGIEILTAL